MSNPADPTYPRWPSIQRLSSEDIHITEKIDGTNGIIRITDEGVVLAGSRNRWLSNPDGTPPAKKQDDNFGFAVWVYERADQLKRSPPGTYYGEFYGAGIARKYDMSERRWAMFGRPSFEHVDGVDRVPLLYLGLWDYASIELAVSALAHKGSALVPGFMDPEGVVVHCLRSGAKFKKFCRNDALKHKNDWPKARGTTQAQLAAMHLGAES